MTYLTPRPLLKERELKERERLTPRPLLKERELKKRELNE
jgi:hypothetical protein